jgi:hypothetical protein
MQRAMGLIYGVHQIPRHVYQQHILHTCWRATETDTSHDYLQLSTK